MADQAKKSLQDTFAHRFGEPPPAHEPTANDGTLAYLAGRSSHRRYQDRPVDASLIETLSAAALCAPTKSDLQQSDIVVVQDPALRNAINGLFPEGSWIAKAPAFLVFCGNNRRQRQIHQRRDRPFANDHLDAFFNASVDAAIVLATFVVAAERVGLGCCPISAVRNHAERVSDLLGLPDHVFPVAGMTLGWPEGDGEISPRLPLGVTLHTDRFSEQDLSDHLDTYDARRAAIQPLTKQRYGGEEGFETVTPYTWSEDKARQYCKPERADFGAFIRSKGFKLD
ncbi:MAG: NADPH-dependent oxidoreductase [Alphaproteobacteria bacterium]|jgi:nitroreductase|nr:NADPH-dependent oxidoreductase [Alphaproteobacteria bacterium]